MKSGVWAALMLASGAVQAAGPDWQTVSDTPEALTAIDAGSVEHMAGRVRFRERQSIRGAELDAATLRPVREVLEKRLIDCRAARIATLSRAVFSDDDAMIDHRAVRPDRAVWQPVLRSDPRFRLLCGRG
ncbi:hypothetical protein F8A86_04800 [Betaproteobacteria bacterium SCN1]|nr:hypothetical protein F8A86_04800 [Betaproteobacteria bacterium SCN1]